MKLTPWIAAGALVAATLLTPAANAAGIVNGSFETGDFTGWVPNEVSYPVYIVTSPVQDGAYAAQIAGYASGPDTLSQTVATTLGQTYTLSFWYWQDGGLPNGFDASWNGTSVFSQVDIAGGTNVAYEHVAVSVVGTGSDLLRFTAYNDPAFTYVDNVSLSVPEPASWAMMLAGFGGMGMALRARRQKVAAA